MLFTTRAGIALLIFFAMNMLVFALLNVVAGEYLVAIGDVVSGLIALAFLPKHKPHRV
jgi:hypothetical protein